MGGFSHLISHLLTTSILTMKSAI